VDCGGATCVAQSALCADTKGCQSGADCQSGVCQGQKCQAPTCTDTLKNGDESDVDCGGAKCPGCANGKACSVAGDCVSKACTSKTCSVWQARYGDGNLDQMHAVKVDGSGNVFFVAEFAGTVDFGTQKLTSTGVDGVLVKLDANRDVAWTRRASGGGANEYFFDLALTPTNDVVVSGRYEGGGSLPPSCTLPGKSHAALVAKLDQAGNCLWAKGVGGPTALTIAYGVATDPTTGDVFIAGQVNGAVDLGTGSSVAGFGGADIFVAKLAGSDGKTLWARGFGTTGGEHAIAIAVGKNGHPVVTGFFSTALTLDTFPLTTTPTGNSDIFVTQLDGASGVAKWAINFGCGNLAAEPVGPEAGYGVAADGNSDVYVVGRILPGACTLGGATPPANGNSFVAKYSAASGAHLWSRVFASTSGGSSNDVAIDSQGNPVVTGGSGGPIDFGTGTLPGFGSSDAYVAKFAGGNGAPLYAKVLGSTSQEIAGPVAVGPGDRVFMGGRFLGTLDFGPGAMTSAGSWDMFIADLGPLP
jgi:hypothetical protein